MIGPTQVIVDRVEDHGHQSTFLVSDGSLHRSRQSGFTRTMEIALQEEGRSNLTTTEREQPVIGGERTLLRGSRLRRQSPPEERSPRNLSDRRHRRDQSRRERNTARLGFEPLAALNHIAEELAKYRHAHPIHHEQQHWNLRGDRPRQLLQRILNRQERRARRVPVFVPIRHFRREVRLESGAHLIHPRQQLVKRWIELGLVTLLHNGPCPIDKTARPNVVHDAVLKLRPRRQLSASANPGGQPGSHFTSLDPPLVFTRERVSPKQIKPLNEVLQIKRRGGALDTTSKSTGEIPDPQFKPRRRQIAPNGKVSNLELGEKRIKPGQDRRDSRPQFSLRQPCLHERPRRRRPASRCPLIEGMPVEPTFQADARRRQVRICFLLGGKQHIEEQPDRHQIRGALGIDNMRHPTDRTIQAQRAPIEEVAPQIG